MPVSLLSSLIQFELAKEDISDIDDNIKKMRASGEAKKELEEMIGLDAARELINKAIANFKLSRLYSDRGLSREKASMHMVFMGNPGTAKTTVARLLAEILRDEKVLPVGQFVEVGRADMVGCFVGQTAPLVKSKFRKAKGGVLFIDEAYALCDGTKGSFGDEAINTIVQEMENHRDDTLVIFAGYPEPMKEFLERNPGMTSRIAFSVNFDDYSVDELCEITRLMVSKKKLAITESAVEKLKGIYEKASKEKDYGNGRFVRKMIEEAEMNIALRVADLEPNEISNELMQTIEECDIPDGEHKKTAKQKIGFACAS